MAKKKVKRCTKCGKIKDITSFYKNKARKDGFFYICIKCYTVYRKKYWKTGEKERERAYHLKHAYGITVDEYNKMLKRQNYKCAICGKPQSACNRNLDVDHNHRTKFVRGLLCQYCNGRLLRYLRDHKNLAIGLVEYLRRALKNDTTWELKRKYDNE